MRRKKNAANKKPEAFKDAAAAEPINHAYGAELNNVEN